MALLKELLADPHTAVSRAGTSQGRHHLAASFIAAVSRQYAGTRLGRQELEGEIVEERQDALWSRGLIEACPELRARARAGAHRRRRGSAGTSPPGSELTLAASSRPGIDDGGRVVHVLDGTALACDSPAAWASATVALARRLEADAIVVEVNQGGEMASGAREADPGLPVTTVRATRGKYVRAEPVSHLYGSGPRVRHVGTFPTGGRAVRFRPRRVRPLHGPLADRLDALVWAVTALALGPKAASPGVRGWI